MGPKPPSDLSVLHLLLERARGGDAAAVDQLLGTYREYIREVVRLRIGTSVRRREDSSDVVQETLLQASRRLADYFEREPMPFPLWIRRTAQECLADLHRRHVGTQGRSVLAEVALPPNLSAELFQQLHGGPNPLADAIRNEASERLQRGLALLDHDDREIILLRIFEQLPNHEAASVLGLEPSATSKRFTRALLRLRQTVKELDSSDAY